MQSHPDASITIPNIDPSLKERLRARAAQHGHSMEAEAHDILQAALPPRDVPLTPHLYDRVRARLAPFGGIDLKLPSREQTREPPSFE